MAEAMDKKCFHNTFKVMETPIVHGIGLHRVGDSFSFIAKILIDREVVEDRVEDQRTQILKEEKCAI